MAFSACPEDILPINGITGRTTGGALLNRQGTTILLVEQNARMALRVAHRGYVIQTGRIVLQDEAGALLRSDLVRKTYLREN